MAKYKSGNFFQYPRQVFKDEKFYNLSVYAKWLFTVFCELEHRFTAGITKRKKKPVDFFFRSDADLSKDTGIKLTSLKKAKKELITTGFVQSWQMHWIADQETGRLSEKKITAYRMLV